MVGEFVLEQPSIGSAAALFIATKPKIGRVGRYQWIVFAESIAAIAGVLISAWRDS
jgi:hypothetical protein